MPRQRDRLCQITPRRQRADDLDFVELVMELEDTFSITIPDETVVQSSGGRKWQKLTMQALCDLVNRRGEIKPNAPADPDAGTDGF